MSYSKTIFEGRMGSDPDLKYTSGQGKPYLTFDLAVERNWAPNGKEKETDWPRITVWDQTAKFLATYAKKGTVLLVDCRYKTRKHTKAGADKPTTYHEFEVGPEGMARILSNGKTKEEVANSPAPPAANAAPDTPPVAGMDNFSDIPDDDDGDLPF